jgi:MFS family permease
MTTQVYFMSKVNRWSKRIKSTSLIFIGNLISLGVILGFWLSYDYIYIVFINILLGFSWSCLYIGTILEVTRVSDLNKGRNIGAVQSTRSLAEIIGPVIGGMIANLVGLRGMIFYMSSFVLASVIASAWLMKRTR